MSETLGPRRGLSAPKEEYEGGRVTVTKEGTGRQRVVRGLNTRTKKMPKGGTKGVSGEGAARRRFQQKKRRPFVLDCRLPRLHG